MLGLLPWHCHAALIWGHATSVLLSMISTGLSGIYQGLTATILKQGTNQAIRFFVYTNLKNYFQGGDPSKDIGNIRTFMIGGLAGAASVFGNTPIDVVKTRMQVGHDELESW